MNSVQIVSSILQAANNKLVSKEFQEKYRIGNSFSRSRKLSFSTLIYFILQSVPKSIPINYSQLLDSFPSPLPFVSKQAISKARQKISDGAFQEFFSPFCQPILSILFSLGYLEWIFCFCSGWQYHTNSRVKRKRSSIWRKSQSNTKTISSCIGIRTLRCIK